MSTVTADPVLAEKKSASSGLKKLFFIGMGFGAGFVLTGAIIAGSIMWWMNRPTPPQPPPPWNRQALTTTFRNAGIHNKNAANAHYDLRYIVENKTGQDYDTRRISGVGDKARWLEPDGVDAMLELKDSAALTDSVAIRLEHFKVLAGRKVMATVHLGTYYDKDGEHHQLVAKMGQAVSAFVVLDESKRYELRLPFPSAEDVDDIKF